MVLVLFRWSQWAFAVLVACFQLRRFPVAPVGSTPSTAVFGLDSTGLRVATSCD